MIQHRLRGARLALPLLALAGLLALPLAWAEDPPAAAPEDAAAPERVEIPWVKDYEAARAQARQQKKHLLINFTGSDWCGWCHRLEGEVFAHKEFVEGVAAQYVLVYLDFPRGEAAKAKVVDPTLNERLSTEYEAFGYPTIVLADAEGVPYARTGYQPDGPAAYLTHLAELRTQGAPLLELAQAGPKATSEQVKATFTALAEAAVLGHPAFAWVSDRILELDADGALGFKSVVLAHSEEVKLRALLPKSEGQTLDVEAVTKLLLESQHLNGDLFVQLGFHCAMTQLRAGKPAEAKALAQKVAGDPLVADPRTQGKIAEFVKQCDQALAKAAGEPSEEEGAAGDEK